ncbi:hypothetical protein [Bradyrhizobium sp. SZCCHNR3118]|uniref:hypothetical protein n=1 Tax=Bradyrhizobium sp. SZCCHNR3118 TaxID=3057468 RepID=UPI002915E162|nr:hypothetical protein [Bradyrhizobium sp. SZCCHNR3118]
MTRLVIRVKHHPNGTSTISGFPTRYVRDVFTAASLRQYDLEKEYKDKPELPEINGPWFAIMRTIIDMVEVAPRWRHGYEFVPVTQLEKRGRILRLQAAREARKSRLASEEMFEKIMAWAMARRQAKASE